MRYSKKKKITIAIISFVCVLFIGFIIFKGINDSMKMSEGVKTKKTDNGLLASVSKITKKIKKKGSKKSATKSTTKKTNETKKVIIKKKETKTTEDKKEEEKIDNSMAGHYVVTALTIGGKKYSKDDIKKLISNGYSLYMDINSDGTVNVSVLYIDKLYSYDNEIFDDGTNKIKYTKKGNKIKIKIDDADIVFKKE